MPTVLLRLTAPMQSWGTTSRFVERDTGKEPSKSGVLGLIASAMGIDRSNWEDLQALTGLAMAVRHDRPGMLRREYQTAGCASEDDVIRADGGISKDGIVSVREYIADATFLVGLSGDDGSLLERIYAAIHCPVWPLYLGRKSYVPTEPIWIEHGLRDGALMDVLSSWPWLGSLRWGEDVPERLLVSFESGDSSGSLRMDQPLSSFAIRRFGARFVRSEWIPFPPEVNNDADQNTH